MKKIKAVLVLALGLFLAACQNTTSSSIAAQSDSKKLSVVTSFYPVYYMAQAVAGDHADVSMLVNGTVDPHDYEPSAKDIASISNADLFVYSSPNMETWVETVQNSLSSSKVTFVSSGKDVTFIEGEEDHDHDHADGEDHDHEHEEGLDPHIWLEPGMAKTQVSTIAAAFIEKDPAHQADYEKNRDALLAQLDQLVASYTAAFASASQRTFVTQHAAFGYVAKTYKLEQLSVSGLLSSEPTAQEIAHVVEEMKEHGLNTIYVDAASSQATAQTVAKETGASIENLYTLESPVEGKTYIEVLQANLDALKKSIK